MSAPESGRSRFNSPHTDGVRSVQSECRSPSPVPAKRVIAPNPVAASTAGPPLSGFTNAVTPVALSAV